MHENRLARVEAQLSGHQRVLAWMHRQQQLGGYMQMVTRNAEKEMFVKCHLDFG